MEDVVVGICNTRPGTAGLLRPGTSGMRPNTGGMRPGTAANTGSRDIVQILGSVDVISGFSTRTSLTGGVTTRPVTGGVRLIGSQVGLQIGSHEGSKVEGARLGTALGLRPDTGGHVVVTVNGVGGHLALAPSTLGGSTVPNTVVRPRTAFDPDARKEAMRPVLVAVAPYVSPLVPVLPVFSALPVENKPPPPKLTLILILILL